MVCSRCALKGHLAADCSTELYCVICDGHDHVNHRCHLLKQPRPVAHAVGYAVAGLGFYHIPHPPLSRKKDSKNALVKVVGGTLSIDQIVAQLQRVVSSKWKWEPVTHDEDSFVVQFPSKNELQRAIAFGGADVRDKDVPSGVRLQFDEWHEEEEGYLLPKVWIRVTGIRKKLREFLNLCAIGSMLGSTQTVDMETTRKSNFGRILVAVLDPKLLPHKLDTVIGDHYFDLKFEMEPVGFDDNGDEVIFNFEEGNDGDNQGMEEDDPNAERGLDREGKRSRREHDAAPSEQDAALGKDGTSANSNKNTLSMSEMLREEMEAKVQRMAAEIIDMAVDKTLDFCVDNVLAEGDDEQGLGAMEDDSSAFDTFSDGSSGVGWVTGSEIAASEKLPPVDRPSRAGERLVAGCLVRRGSGSAPPTFRAELQQPDLGARPTDQLAVAAGIKEVALSPTRASPRLASVADQHILEKAKKRAAWRNLDTEGNTTSFCSFSDHGIASKLSGLGVDVGSSSKDVADSVLLLRKLEVQRHETRPHSLMDRVESEFDQTEIDEQDNFDLENLTLGHLCGDFMEEVMDEDSDHLSCDFQAVFKKNKSKCAFRKKGNAKIRVVRKNKKRSNK